LVGTTSEALLAFVSLHSFVLSQPQLTV